jgi:hypothetical protein
LIGQTIEKSRKAQVSCCDQFTSWPWHLVMEAKGLLGTLS